MWNRAGRGTCQWLLPLALVAIMAALAGCGTTSGKELEDTLEQVQSVAVDAQLTAIEANRGALSDGFVSSHERELSAEAGRLSAQLRSPAIDPSVRPCADGVANGAELLAGKAQQLADAPGDRLLARQVASDLDAIQDQLRCPDVAPS